MGKKPPKLERGRDFTKHLRRNGCPVRRGNGSHIVATLPDGSKITYYDGEISKGVKSKLKKALAAAGLLGFAVGAILGYLHGAM